MAKFLTFAHDQYSVDIDPEDYPSLAKAWEDMFPEMKQHLKGIPDPNHPGMFLAETITGRIRANAPFCSSLNNPFQGLAADGAKIGMIVMWMSVLVDEYPILLQLGCKRIPQKEDPGCNGTGFVHDEILDEVSLKLDLEKHIEWKEEQMIYGMRQVCPDVTGVKVESALMVNWNKKAKEIHDSTGRWAVWTPDIATFDKEDPLTKLSKDELIKNCPSGFRPVWGDRKCNKPFGWQPQGSIVEWGT